MEHEFKTRYEDIRLIPMSMEDSEKYRNLRNRPDVRINFKSKRVISADEQKVWYENYLHSPNEVMFSIFSDDIFLGGNSLYKINNNDGTAEYGRIIIDKQYSGNSFGYKATMATMKIAKEKLLLKEIYLEVYKSNIAAYNTYKKAMFIEISSRQDEDGEEIVLMKKKL